MSDKHITIVVKGSTGSGRTQIAEKIKLMLLAEGFQDVTVADVEKIDLFEGHDPKKNLPIYITEG